MFIDLKQAFDSIYRHGTIKILSYKEYPANL